MGERKQPVSTATATTWDGAAEPSVSTTLREARQGLGVELRDVASMLRIRYPYLQAIEDGRYDELPGTAYATGFLRSYAEYLGLDPEMILRRYKDEAAGRVGKQEFYLPTPVAEGRVPGGTVLLGTLVLAGIVYGGWYYLSATDRSVADMVPVLPDRLVSLLDNLPWTSNTQTASVEAPAAPAAPSAVAPATPSTLTPPTTPAPATVAAAPAAPPAQGGISVSPPPAPPPAAAPPAPAPVAAAPAPAVAPPTPAATPPAARPSSAVPPQAQPQSPAPQAAVIPPSPHGEEDEADMARQEPTPLSPASAPPAVPQPPAAQADANGKIYGSQNASARFQVRALQDSWVQVRDSQEVIFTRVLKAGDTYRVPERPGVRLRTGNAGGLVLVTDGVAGQPMGSIGQVLRDVPLDGSAKPAR